MLRVADLKMDSPLCTAVALLLLSAVAAAAEPRIHLTSPRPGWTTQRVVRIAGTVTPADDAHEVRLIFNGIPQSVALDRGVFEIDQVLAPGGNEIRMVAAGADGTAVASVWLHASVPPADLKVILTWDARDADVDLRVLDPSGERCDFNHSGTAAGGRLDLDVSDGYGPEIFTQTHAPPGKFRVSVRLFRGPPQRPVRCRIDVILREGRPDEERRIYRVVLARPGEDTVVAELEAVGDA